MPCRNRARHNRTSRDVEAPLRQALDLIPIPSITVQQKSSFLNHIAKVFFFILQEFMNNRHRICPPFDRPSSSTLMHELWQHHLDSLQAQEFELSEVQVFFDIP